MQPKIVRATNWLTFTLLGIAGGWLIFGKALAPGGLALLLGRKPGELPAKERFMTFDKKDRSNDHDSSPLLTVATTTTDSKPSASTAAILANWQRLPAAALDAAGLTEADRPAAEAIIDSAWQQMEQELSSQVRPITDPKAKEGEKTYVIAGDKAAGDAVLVQMRKQLQETFGKEATAAILAGMHLERYFAAFGQRDVKITVGSSSGDFIHLFYSNPADGRAIESNAVMPEVFVRIFGKVIPLPEKAGDR